MAFSDDMIRGLVHTGAYSNPQDEQHLAGVLIARRDKLGATYLNAITPLVDFALTAGGELSFSNAAVAAGVAQPPGAGYQIEWANFDNTTGAVSAIGGSRAAGEHSSAPSALPPAMGSFVRVRISVADAAADLKPVDAFFRRNQSGWALVGIDRGISTTTALKEKTS